MTMLIKRLPLLLGLPHITSPAPVIPQIILQKDNISPFTTDDTVIHLLFMMFIRLLSLAHRSPHVSLSKGKLIHSTVLAITNMQMTPNFSSLAQASPLSFQKNISLANPTGISNSIYSNQNSVFFINLLLFQHSLSSLEITIYPITHARKWRDSWLFLNLHIQ